MHQRAEIAVCVSALSLKDAFFLISMQLKRMERQASGRLDGSIAKAANEIAWSCIRQLVETTIVVPTGRSESLQAFVFQPLHNDFEDNLIAATAQHSNAGFLVSNDESLVKHAPVACLSSSDAIALLESERIGI